MNKTNKPLLSFVLLLWAVLNSQAAGTNAACLSLERREKESVIVSTHQPGWRISFNRSKGLADDLRVPANSDTDILSGHEWAYAFGRWLAFHDQNNEWKERDTFRKGGDVVTGFEIVGNTPGRIVLAIQGYGPKNDAKWYEFRQHVVIVPSGIRLDQEITVTTRELFCTVLGPHFWFRQGVLPDHGPVEIWDARSAPREVNPALTQDDPVPLPKGIDYPYELRLPYRLAPDVSFRFRAIEVPERVRARREWSLPLGFGPKFGWTWWWLTGGDPGVIDGQPDLSYNVMPPGQPGIFSLEWQVTTAKGMPAPIPAFEPRLPEWQRQSP